MCFLQLTSAFLESLVLPERDVFPLMSLLLSFANLEDIQVSYLYPCWLVNWSVSYLGLMWHSDSFQEETAAWGLLCDAQQSTSLCCLLSQLLTGFIMKGLYQHRRISRDAFCVYWYACKIICTVTPPDRRLWTKPFPCCFIASLMIPAAAGSVDLLCSHLIRVSVTPRSQWAVSVAF